MDNTIIRYSTQKIDPNLLSVLDITQEGKIVSAQNWIDLWTLVFKHINTIDEYCLTIDTLRTNWEEAKAELEAKIIDFKVKYNALKENFIHYGEQPPENEHIRLWIQPSNNLDLRLLITQQMLKTGLNTVVKQVEQVDTELRSMIGTKVNTSDLYIEEQAGYVSKGIFNYFENAKGGTSIELAPYDEDWPGWEFTVCGANIVKPLETHTTSGVTFTKRDDGSIKIVGTATETSFVPVTDWCTNGGVTAMVSGMGLYIIDYPNNTTLASIGREGYVVSYDTFTVLELAFKIETGKTYNHTVYPMVTLGAGKKPFEPYKDYGKVYLPSDVSETTIFTFPEDGDYYIYDSWNWGECPFSCSAYTKKTANYIPEADRGNFVTVDEFAEAQNTKVKTLTTSLEANNVYRVSINKSMAFVLPAYVDTTILNSIELQVTISNYDNISIDLGATKYFGDIPELNNGSYIIYYEHNGTDWCVGALEIVGA